MTDAELQKLAEILAILKREGVELVPLKDDGTAETIQ